MTADGKKIRIAIVDDHKLFRKGLISLISSISDEFEVTLEANNGKEFLEQLERSSLPDIAIIDANMPVMTGFDTVVELRKKKYESIRVLIITMVEDESALIRMLRLNIK